MSRYWFTADCHFDHANIILYSGRPFYTTKDVWFAKDIGIQDGEWTDTPNWIDNKTKFRCCNWMNKTMINNWNKLVKPEDIVYHLGDFCFRRDNTYHRFASQLNGTIIHIRGNHDRNNGVKTLLERVVMEFGNKVIYALHIPPSTPLEIPEWADMVLCGHVHNYWKHKFLEGCDTPIINVGVDVWGFEPINVNTILKYYNKLMKGKE